LGVLLLLGAYRKASSLLLLLVMCFMTPLTLYMAFYNPVSDCGCFGDALILTNWQTFYKNIVLLTAAIIVWRGHKWMTPLVRANYFSLVATGITVVLITGLTLYCLVYLPIIDFRPYKVGNNIKALSFIPADAPSDEYETILIYAKEGVAQKFTMADYPKEGSGWEFVDAEIKLVKKGYEPPIHNFTITTESGEDITEQVLDYQGYTFLLVAHKLESANASSVKKLNEIADFVAQRGHHFIGLTASLPQEISAWKAQKQTIYPWCTMDDITLKTIVRSNPGLVLLHNATVVSKWSHNNLPSENELIKLMR
jgi:hypothetical protein